MASLSARRTTVSAVASHLFVVAAVSFFLCCFSVRVNAQSDDQCWNGTHFNKCTTVPPVSSDTGDDGYKWEIALVGVCAGILLTFGLLTFIRSRQKKAQKAESGSSDKSSSNSPTNAAVPTSSNNATNAHATALL